MDWWMNWWPNKKQEKTSMRMMWQRRILEFSVAAGVIVAGLSSTMPAVNASPFEPPQEIATSPSGAAARITFGNGQLSFVAPPGFTQLTAQEIAQKFNRGNPPRNVLGNARRTTTIAYDLLDQRAPSTDLEAARKTFVGIYEQTFRGLKWVASDRRPVGALQTAYFEFTAPAADQDIHNVVLVSVFAGRVLMFNFNSTAIEFPQVEPSLRKSMASIAIAPSRGR
jgi:hypothetical protein